MPLPRIFRAAPSQDWLSPLIVVSKGLVAAGNYVPFPYVNAALSAGLALLELIQMVGKSSDDLRYLAQSVVTIMQLLREEMDHHSTAQDTRFHQLCIEFATHLAQLSKDIEALSRDRSSSKFKKYINSQTIRDQITEFTQRVQDTRANTTLVAAIGTRMDLVEVANGVAVVESKISDIQQDLNSLRSLTQTKVTGLPTELVPYEEDFHALKLGDIHLEFTSARTAEFVEIDTSHRQERKIGWTDYRATVKGSIRTVRVYQGSDPMDSWKGFLSVLAEASPSPNFPQLFGFCSSPRLRSLVFHGEFCTLDEYGNSLSSPQALVDWEINLITDFSELVISCRGLISQSRPFALVNGHDGKLVISHVKPLANRDRFLLPPNLPPFLDWFIEVPRWDFEYDGPKRLLDSQRSMRDMLRTVTSLRRRSHVSSWAFKHLTIYEVLTSRGRVYRSTVQPPFRYLERRPLVQLSGRQITHPHSWEVKWIITHERGSLGPVSWDPACFATLGQSEPGWTHFIVPLLDNARHWISGFDQLPHCGYFLNATMKFGESVPDITCAWLAQASSIMSNLDGRFDESNLDEFCIPAGTTLDLSWEMVLAAENTATTSESLAILSELPENLHVFVQVPVLDGPRLTEPAIYWSTEACTVETGRVPRGALKISASWDANMLLDSWLPHHYAVVRSAQEDHGFDPTSKVDADALGLPLLEIPDPGEFEGSEREPDWVGFYEMDPHTMQKSRMA
ncbi:hypothetical protein FB451DRAFT_1214305 [Mycena latifolia]|nr:hypothetical protein FB451DRAFT_1214305 [Mycena latifolia]